MWLDAIAHFLERLTSPLAKWLNLIAVGVLLLMVFFVTADVFLRYGFNHPIEGSYETVELMMVFVFAFGIAYTQKHKGHVAVDMLVSRFSVRTQAVVDSIIYFIGLIFLSVLTWQALVRARVVWLANEISFGKIAGISSVPFAPFYYMVALTCLALCIAFLADFFTSLAKAVRK